MRRNILFTNIYLAFIASGSHAMEGTLSPIPSEQELVENQDQGQRTLTNQIERVKAYLPTVQHPRLVLGVGNTTKKNSMGEKSPFLNNPNDILGDLSQDNEVLKERSLSFDFNNLDQLNQLATAFADTFDVITADQAVTKFADWTQDHIAAFNKMLKKGGELFFTVETAPSLYTEQSNTVEQLFEVLDKDENISKSDQLFLKSPSRFAFLPQTLAVTKATVSLDPQIVQREVNLYKQNWFDEGWPQNLDEKRDKFEEFIKTNGSKTASVLCYRMTDDIIRDDKMLNDMITNVLNGLAKQHAEGPLLENLSKEFYEQYVIQKNIIPIMSKVFPVENIKFEENLPMPQPHNNNIAEQYSLYAKKES